MKAEDQDTTFKALRPEDDSAAAHSASLKRIAEFVVQTKGDLAGRRDKRKQLLRSAPAAAIRQFDEKTKELEILLEQADLLAESVRESEVTARRQEYLESLRDRHSELGKARQAFESQLRAKYPEIVAALRSLVEIERKLIPEELQFNNALSADPEERALRLQGQRFWVWAGSVAATVSGLWGNVSLPAVLFLDEKSENPPRPYCLTGGSHPFGVGDVDFAKIERVLAGITPIVPVARPMTDEERAARPRSNNILRPSGQAA